MNVGWCARRMGLSLGMMLLTVCGNSLSAQVSFTSAITLALQNSPRVKMAQDDVNRSYAALTESRDLYIPSVGVGGGVGRSYGITLTVPTIFTVTAQSLVYSAPQREYIRAARQTLQASTLTLKDVREQVEEDAAATYVALDQAQMRAAALNDAYGYAQRLVAITEDRVGAGIETELDLKRSRRQAVQTRLQKLQVEDEIASLREHLGELMGMAADTLTTVPGSVPTEFAFAAAGDGLHGIGESASVLSAEADARAKLDQALGDTRSLRRPQVYFQSQYGRISPINDVSSYYNLNGKYNTFYAAASIQFQIFDRARIAHAQGTMASALHAQHEVENLRGQETESRLKLEHSVAELSTRAELAELDRGIAEDELSAMLVEVQRGDAGGRQMTPKDEQNARFEERMRYLSVLDATLDLRKADLSLLRQTGMLEAWLKAVVVDPRYK
jgi:outer membrane protein TolC